MPKYSSLSDVQVALKSGELTCVKLVEYYLRQIEESQDLNIYVEVFEAEALAKAKALDVQHSNDPTTVGRLFGLVVSIKDVLCYKDHEVTAASKMLEGFISVYSATAVERLVQEDAIIIGRVNCDEFAMGSSNENSVYGPTKNAVDPNRIPGGSSGASAVAVQADTCLVSLGTDTGGSVRQPAGFCGLVGFKPSYGRISRYGLLAYASSFDQVGVLANSVSDVAILLEVLAGADEFDASCSQEAIKPYSELLSFTGKAKIAYMDAAFNHERIDSEIRSHSLAFLEQLKTAGHEVESIDFEYLDYIIPAYYVLTTAEASSNLSRFDGVRFGHRSKDAKDLVSIYKQSRSEGFGAEVKCRIMLGTFVLSTGYYDAYYAKAQKVRRLISNRTKEIFETYDFIVMPVSPSGPWSIGEKMDDPVAVYLSDVYTVQANMSGIPALSLPLGKKDKNGMPIGIQLMANCFDEARLLAFSNSIG